MKQQATVREDQGRLVAEVIRPEACAQCRACRYGQSERVLVPLPEGDYAVGDRIELELDEASFSKASLLAYAFPIALFLAGLFGARLFTDSEPIMALSAFALLGIGLMIMRLLEPRLKKSGKFTPAARKCEAALHEDLSEGGEENVQTHSVDQCRNDP